MGPRLIGGANEIETRRVETAKGWTVEASHDFYVRPFGIRHEREVTLSPQGLALTGAATGPELAAVLTALPRQVALTRAARAKAS